MAKRMEKADVEVMGVLKHALEAHPELTKYRVRIAVLMVWPNIDEKTGKPKGSALKHHGVPAVATVTLVNKEWRILGGFDVVIKVDAYEWCLLLEESQLALMDHELTHIEIAFDEDGNPQAHDDGGMKLYLRPEDWVLTGFAAVIKRHGRHAVEAAAFRHVHEAFTEVFEFMLHPEKQTPKRQNGKTAKREKAKPAETAPLKISGEELAADPRAVAAVS